MADFDFDPPTGLLDTSAYPDVPASPTAARQQFMDLFYQARDVIRTNANQIGNLSKKTGWLDVITDYGAIGDGVAHPLSASFTTLTLAQAKYPNAGITSLSQELNWAAFNQAFYDVNISNLKLRIPSGSYYIKDPLNVIASQKANTSIEYTNFAIEGDGIGRTILIFDFSGDTTWAMDVIVNSAKMDIGGFTIKNLQVKQGCGIRVNGLYSGNVHDILSFHFYIGADLTSYITEIKNVTGAYCSCGIIWRSGTSTNIQNCYASNASPRDVSDTAAWSGVGHYFLGYVYSTFSALASDNCTQPYKFNGTNTIRLKLDNCGAEAGGASQAVYVNNPNATINVDGLSLSGISGIANIQSVNNIEFNNVSDTSLQNMVLGTTVTPGQVRIKSRLNTISNPALMTGKTPSINQGVKGVNDLAYDLVNYAAFDFMQNGRGILRGNTLEFTIKIPSNGLGLALKVDVMPYQFYDTTAADYRAGSVFISAFNNSGGTYGYSKSTDTNINVTVTTIDTLTVKVVISPFVGLPSATAHNAIFKIDAYFTTDTFDQNIKTNRNALKIKGVDY